MLFDIYPGKGLERDGRAAFSGLNRTRRAVKGEFSDMKNMGTLEYPCAAPRGSRAEVFSAAADIDAVAAPDSTDVGEPEGFTGIAGGAFYYNGTVRSGTHSLAPGLEWEIIRIGNLYIINGYDPDTVSSQLYYYNIDNEAFGIGGGDKYMDSLIVTAGNDSGGSYLATFRYGFTDVYDYEAENEDGSEVIANADFFDKYGDPVIEPPNIFERVFSEGDEVEITGFPSRDENFGQIWTYAGASGKVTPQPFQDFSHNNTVDTDLYATLDDVDKYTVTNAYIKSFSVDKVSISGTDAYVHKVYFRLVNKFGDELTFDSMNDDAVMYCSGVTVSRRRRVFDHIAAHNGRLWGTAPTGNRIYISNSNDWFDFTPSSIVAGYSGRLESDTPGTFTGLAEYGAELVAFKEDSVTVIYGSGSYSVSVIPGIGCIDGHSIAVTPSGVIFLGYGGFYGFSGSVPSRISEKLNAGYVSAAAGFDGDIYYASAVRGDSKTELLAYDTRYGTWHLHDGFPARGFFRHRSRFYAAGARKVFELGRAADDTVEWSFTSVPEYYGSLGIKAVSEIWIRAELAEDAEFTVYTSVDSGGFARHSSFKGGGMRVVRCPVRAVMGSSCRYRIDGKGEAVFYEIELRGAEGGGRYKRGQEQ